MFYDPYGKQVNPDGYGYFARLLRGTVIDYILINKCWMACPWDQCGYYIHREREVGQYKHNGEKTKVKTALFEDMQMIGLGSDEYCTRDVSMVIGQRQDVESKGKPVVDEKNELPNDFVATRHDMADTDAWLRIATVVTPAAYPFILQRLPRNKERQILYSYSLPRPGHGQVQNKTAGRGGEPSYDWRDFKPATKICMLQDGQATSKLYLEPEHRVFGFHGPDPGGFGVWTLDKARDRLIERAKSQKVWTNNLVSSHPREGPWFSIKDLMGNV